MAIPQLAASASGLLVSIEEIGAFGRALGKISLPYPEKPE
jgi:hypothetical protein